MSNSILPDPCSMEICGAYYNWLNQQRLPGAEQSSFLVWFENHGEAVAIGPAMSRGTVSNSTADIGQIVSWMT